MGYFFEDEKLISPQQRKQRQRFRRWWRSFKKEGELLLPFFVGILILGFVGFATVQMVIT
tara:strand:+ start:1715 stop:1894 length:180 start_codon:yes stop_codon:yes gene_type:complete